MIYKIKLNRLLKLVDEEVSSIILIHNGKVEIIYNPTNDAIELYINGRSRPEEELQRALKEFNVCKIRCSDDELVFEGHYDNEEYGFTNEI